MPDPGRCRVPILALKAPILLPASRNREGLIEVKALSGHAVSTKQSEETLITIEQTQAALRDSIEKARELAEESERLVRKHREEMAKPPNPAA